MTGGAPLTLEEVARYPRPGTAVPGRIAFAPDGRTVTFLYSAQGSLRRDLWQLDVASGERSRLLEAGALGGGETEANVSLEEQLRRERERLRETGITHYEWAAVAPVLLIPVRGDLYVHREGRTRCVARGATDAHLSRDGRLVALVRDGDLYVVETESGAERRLTHDAAPGITNGLAEFIAQEEMGRRRGCWLSPDGSLVAFARVDERHIPTFRIAHAAHGPYDAEEHRYPFAGAQNARVTLGVVPTDGSVREVRWLDLGEAEYLARVDWHPDGHLLVQLQSRDQRRLELRAYDPATGAARTLLVETAETWINLHGDLRPLAGGRFLWASERTGFKHLYLYQEDRLLRALTAGDWMVDGVIGVDEGDAPAVTFTGTRDGPLQRHVYRVSLAGGEIERLTAGPGMHDAVAARDGSALVVTSHHRGQAPRVVVQRLSPGGSAAAQAAHVIHDPPALSYPAPELLALPAADGTTLHGALYRPPEGTRYPAPLIVQVYGGPHAQTVQDGWGMAVNLRAQYLASQGFAVWLLDNRGTARRGLRFESALHRRMGTVEVEDQVAGVRYLVAEGIADPARVGIYGWSYGGYMTLMCLLKAPDVFRAGVAGAPVVEWEGYDTHYTERYMGTPQDNPQGYREGSVLTHVGTADQGQVGTADQGQAGNLRGALLVVHGMIDENVHFRHTARLVDALVKANKPHELLLFPDERHMPRRHQDLVALEARIAAFFQRELGLGAAE